MRLIGTTPEVIWGTPAEAKFAIKELRLVKRDMAAKKRDASSSRTTARRAKNLAAVANYTYQYEAWDQGIRAVEDVIRDLDRWLLYNPK